MRLLSAEAVLHREKDTQRAGRQIKIFEEHDDGTTKYAILSHRWRVEVDYDEMSSLMRMAEPDRNEIKRRSGYEKIIKSCEQALQDGYMWIWIDTCCIDKRNEPELSGAIRSMYRWYSKSQKCYAYLDDVEDRIFPTKQDFSKFAKFNGWPEWFSRGWTLQELVAPKQVEFFNKDWVHIGGKQDLANTLEKVTQIPIDVLKDASEISRRFCVAQIMSWAADRKTTRVEDRAYSLLGLFGVNMPIYYDEKEKAFHRLQLEIIGKFNDHSIFAWNSKGQFSCLGGALAGDPNHFRGCHDIEKVELDEFVDEVMDYYQSGLSMTRNPGSGRLVRSRDRTFRQQLLQRRPAIFHDARSIQICLPVIPHCDSASVFRAILACRDYYGDLITIDLTSPDPLQSSYRICSGRRFRHWGPELRTLCLAYSAPDTKEYHHFKVDDRHTLYHRFSRHGTFPREFTGDTITVSSLTNDLVVIVYANDGAKSRFAVAIGFYLGQGYVHVAYDDYSATDEVPWRDFAKKVSDRLWSAPVEDCSVSGVKCAHLPRAIWDARVVWYSGNMQTNVMVDVQRCSGCCIGPHERISASNDGDGLDMPGFMKAVHKFRGLKLDGKLVWVYQCANQKIALGDYGDYSNGTFRPYGNIFKDMQVDDIDPAYHPVASCVSSDADVLHRRQDQGLTVEFDERLTLHSPEGFSLPNNQQLVLLLKAFSIRLAGKHLVTTIIQCSDLDRAEGERGRKAKASAFGTGVPSTAPPTFIPLCTIASPHVWRREPVCAQRREQFRSIREHFYALVNLHRAEAGHRPASRRAKHEAVKFLSDMFGFENLKEYVGQITFFEKLPLMVETQPRSETSAGDGLFVCLAPSPWNPFKSRAAKNPSHEVVVPPLLGKCEALNELVERRRYLVARQKARREVKFISQTLSVRLLEHIYIAILNASQDETHGIQDTAYARQVDIHSTLREITALQTALDAMEDEDEQRALEEDITGKILWVSSCGILSEVQQLLPEVMSYIRRERNSMALEVRGRFRGCLLEMGNIIKKTSPVYLDDDLAHLRRIMLDAGAGISKHRSWLDARAAEQNKWSSTPASRGNPPTISAHFTEHTHTSTALRTLYTGNI